MNQLYQFAATYALRKPVALNVRMSRHKPRDVIELSELCLKHNSLDLYLWLSFRFPEFFVEQELCLEQKAFAIMAIEDSLDAHTLHQKFSHSQEYQHVRNQVLNGDADGLPPLSYGDVRDTYAKNIKSIASNDLYTFPRMSEEENETEGSSFDKSFPSSRSSNSISRLERKHDPKKHRPADQIAHRPWMTALKPVSESSPRSLIPVNRSAAPSDGVKYQIIYDIATKTYKKISKSEPTISTNTNTNKNTITVTKDLRSWQPKGNKNNYTDDRKNTNIGLEISSNREEQSDIEKTKDSSYLHYISNKVSNSSGSGGTNNSKRSHGNDNNDKNKNKKNDDSNNSNNRNNPNKGDKANSSSSKTKHNQFWARSKLTENQNQGQGLGQKIGDVSRATAI